MTQEQFKEEALRMRAKLLRSARRYLGDGDAEDTVQDVLLRLWQMVDELRPPLDALALALTRNHCIDQLRRRQPTRELTDVAEAPESGDERMERMMRVIDSLPPLQQTILRLRHIEGMEMAELASLIGTTEVALRKALSRARQAVKTQYINRYEQHS